MGLRPTRLLCGVCERYSSSRAILRDGSGLDLFTDFICLLFHSYNGKNLIGRVIYRMNSTFNFMSTKNLIGQCKIEKLY